ncbi:MAG TPA: LLM class F420-dependent oxidoreductase [Candidatus Sulfomarinibacteraceae bacterium]|nr:LLM class F420-dependent oxidoreductase [Candidatus Sulfomarinibacteraceae bacterium]
MKIGLVFPQTEFGTDPTAIREYARAAEELGYTHVLAYDHVLGANPQRPEGWRGPYTYRDPFYSPFLLFSYMAAATERLGFVSGVLILPQRETALVAKQAATLDVLCQGRLRLGIGVGWNPVEYVALNQDFHTRGRRQEAQVAVMRRLWTEPLVTYQDRWHNIPDAGLNPMPVQRPIPIWFGGSADAVIRRMARLGDGWLPNERRAAQAQPLKDKLQQYREKAGRSDTPFGIEPRMVYGDGDPDQWAKVMEEWRSFGATHLSLNTMHAGLQGAEAHIRAMRRFAEEMEIGQ